MYGFMPTIIKSLCPARGISWDKDGVRQGMQIKRPGAAKKLLKKRNPFSRTPAVCDTL